MRWPAARWGRGPTPAVFLHGFTGNRASFDHLAPLLGDVLTAVVPELPGHGEAAAPGGSFLDVVDELAAQLLEPVAVVGYSQGARLGLALAVRHPHLVSRLVVESGTAGLEGPQRVERARADARLAHTIRTEGVAAFIDRWELTPVLSTLAGLEGPAREALRRRRTAHAAEGLARALEVLGQGSQPDLWPKLSRLALPVLVLSGEKDITYTRVARRLEAAIPEARRVVFTGAGHAPHLECPAAYAREVGAFLERARLVEAAS